MGHMKLSRKLSSKNRAARSVQGLRELSFVGRLLGWTMAGCVLCIGLDASLASAAPYNFEAQEGEAEEQPKPLPPLLGPQDAGATDPQQELIDLFHAVERKLQEIDLQLSQAGTGVLPLEAPADAGLDELLREAMRTSKDLSNDIDRMLSIAQEMGSMQQQPGQEGQQGQPQEGNPSGESPLNNNSQGGQQDRESTPEGPENQQGQGPETESPGEESPGEGEQEEPQQDESEGEGDPKNPGGEDPGEEDPGDRGENPESGSNLDGEDPNAQAGAQATPGEDAQRWGELPVRVREVFRNQGREDMPVHYRDWIDAYYRRLNKGDR